jgi:hypothetical protein
MISLVLSGLVASPASGQTFNTAVEYLNYIGAEYSKIAQEQWGYMKAMGKGKSDKVVEKRRTDLLQTIGESKRIVSRMPPFNNNRALRDSVVSFLRVSQAVISEDYAKIVNMQEVAEQSYDAMEAYLLAKELAGKKLTDAAEKVSEQYNAFVAENNVNVIDGGESKLSKRMRETGDLFEYYNKVYLIFFKSYKQDAYLAEALKSGDVNSIEQNRNALLTTSKEGRELIKQHTSFKGDQSLSTACASLLSQYTAVAANQVPVLIEFYSSKEKYEKIKKSIDTQRPADRKQSDIDAYNNAVNEYNAAIKKYNEAVAKMNELEGKALDNWNKKSSAFLQTHMP